MGKYPWNTILLTIPFLILSNTVFAATPSFGDWTATTGGTIDSSSPGNCATGFTCDVLISGDGFLQSNVSEPHSNGTEIGTIVIDSSLATAPDFGDWEASEGTIEPVSPGTCPIGFTCDVIESGGGFTQIGIIENPITVSNELVALIHEPEITVPATGPLTLIDIATLGSTQASQNGWGSSTARFPNVTHIGPFKPGIHTITWTTSNASGDTATATQIIKITPLVTFGPDMIVGEGGTVTIPIYLNGTGHTYPVQIPYSVSGTASNPDDHDANNGIITIDSGTQGTITFKVVDDGQNGEADETIIFSIESPINAARGIRTSLSVTITENNLPPLVSISADQNNTSTRVIAIDRGLVTVTADVNDPNQSDIHSFNWNDTDNSITAISTTSNNTFSFDPIGLTPGFYKLAVTVTDNAVPPVSTSVDLLIKLVPSIPVPAVEQALIKNILLNEPAENPLRFGWQVSWNAQNTEAPALLNYHAMPLQTETGLTLHLGNSALGSAIDNAAVSLEDITEHGGNDGGFAANVKVGESIPAYIVDFEITGLMKAGQSVRLVIPQIIPIPENAIYRKYIPGIGWLNFKIDAFNTVSSALQIDGICPPLGHANYTNGLLAGHQCVQLKIQDGGPNDADGKANAVIKDPSGVAVQSIQAVTPTNSNSDNVESGGGALNLSMLLLFLFGSLMRNNKLNISHRH